MGVVASVAMVEMRKGLRKRTGKRICEAPSNERTSRLVSALSFKIKPTRELVNGRSEHSGLRIDQLRGVSAVEAVAGTDC